MSKKRTSPGSSTDKQTNEDSDLFQKDDNAKRAKLTSTSDTTLQDLPMELIECILIKAVAMEVMGITRKKSEWKETAESVISRLTTVCSQWTSILTTNYFRNELHRTFDAEKTIRLEIVQKFRVSGYIFEAVTLKDDLFVLCVQLYDNNYYIYVYDRNNVAEVKDVIPMEGIEVGDIVACSVSNCLYLENFEEHALSISSLKKTDEHQYKISPLISGLQRLYDIMAVAANGNLVLAWQSRHESCALIAVYDPNGHLLHETKLFADTCCSFYQVIPKSNGNFVLASMNDQWQAKLIEIDMHSNILRQYQSSLRAYDAVLHAGKYGRIAIFNRLSGFELLDSELNQVEYIGLQPDEDPINYWGGKHFNIERDEVVNQVDCHTAVIFRFTEE